MDIREHEPSRFQKVLTGVICGALIVHISILVGLTLSDSQEPMGKSFPASIYHHIFHLGPFFREEAIRSSDHFLVGLPTGNGWNFTDVSGRHVDAYLRSPWKSHELTICDHIRRQAISIKGNARTESKPFRNLLDLTRQEFPQHREADSVRWMLLRRWYQPERHAYRTETVFVLTFRPDDVE